MTTLIQLIIIGTLFSLLIWMLWKYRNAFAFFFFQTYAKELLSKVSIVC